MPTAEVLDQATADDEFRRGRPHLPQAGVCTWSWFRGLPGQARYAHFSSSLRRTTISLALSVGQILYSTGLGQAFLLGDRKILTIVFSFTNAISRPLAKIAADSFEGSCSTGSRRWWTGHLWPSIFINYLYVIAHRILASRNKDTKTTLGFGSTQIWHDLYCSLSNMPRGAHRGSRGPE
ncbi:hypothetical protein BC629DRAFT_1438419 [Irpex lacteus]|nr:hypothetical protein BC629DRAFT_1438419 [Irpex lacteus]